MTRFDASAQEDRRDLFAEGIAAQRERGVGFLTVEVDAGERASQDEESGEGEGSDEGGETGAAGDEAAGDEAAGDATAEEPPWVQFTDGTLNLDCTDAELDRLAGLLDQFPAFTIEERTSPENAEGTNVRVSALVDDERVAAFIEDAFRQVYERHENYRVWVTTL